MELYNSVYPPVLRGPTATESDTFVLRGLDLELIFRFIFRQYFVHIFSRLSLIWKGTLSYNMTVISMQ